MKPLIQHTIEFTVPYELETYVDLLKQDKVRVKFQQDAKNRVTFSTASGFEGVRIVVQGYFVRTGHRKTLVKGDIKSFGFGCFFAGAISLYAFAFLTTVGKPNELSNALIGITLLILLFFWLMLAQHSILVSRIERRLKPYEYANRKIPSLFR